MQYILRFVMAAAAVPCLTFALADPVVGWRMNWTGQYSDVEPVTEWSPTKNVVWATPMPSWSNASPIFVGDFIFVCSEPDELICVNKITGTILWRRKVQLSDTWTDEDRVVVAENLRKSEELKKQYDRLDEEINETFELRRKDPTNEIVRAKYKALQQEQAKILSEISKLNRWAPAKTEPTDGYTSSTPVSDGKHVWVLMGTGVAACFDLSGERVWVKFIERPKHHEGHACSPVLFEGKLILHIQTLRAYDPLRGQMLWECPGVARSWGTPFPTRVGGVPVIVTARGKIVRVSDGQIIGDGAGSLEYASPLVVDNVAYFIQNGGQASRLSLTSPDAVEVTKLWTTAREKDRYYTSPVLHDGLIYTMNQRNLLSVIDAATGDVIKAERLDLGNGDAYTSVSVAGGLLFVGNESGKMAVVELGRHFKVLAINTLDAFRTTPVFEARRMCLRTKKFLYGVGATEAATP
ncbi:MAG: outer membrane protein assembly factor BamB family protein [Kiritimatiellia bacterium]